MLTCDDEVMTRILNETLSIFIPAFNPDGQKIVADWYMSNVGTEYEIDIREYMESNLKRLAGLFFRHN